MKKYINMELSETPFNGNITEYLVSKGVENPEDFLSAGNEITEFTEPNEFSNMNEAVIAVKSAINNGATFGIVVDQDFDGYASSAIIARLLKKNGADIELISSYKKVHGIKTLKDKILMDYDIDFLIIPDGGVNDYDEIRNIVSRDIDVLVLDHHLIEKPDLVNNLGSYMISSQNPLNDQTNENLTGAGMAEKFVIAFDGVADSITQTLASLGQIADASDISNIEIRGIVNRGLDNVNKHPFFKEFGIEEPVYQKDIGWTIAPIINAVSRFGTIDQRLDIVRAMTGLLDIEPSIEIEKKKKNKTTGKFDKVSLLVNEYSIIYDMCKSVKVLQEKELKSTMKSIAWLIKPEVNNVAVAIIPNDSNPALTGLIANKLQSKYGQPVLVGRNINNSFMGSLRSPGQFPFSTWANETGLIKASGHEQAAGAFFDIYQTDDIVEVSKTLDFNNHPVIVDVLFNNGINNRIINMINDNEPIYGGRVNKPLIGIKGLKINKRDIVTKTTMIQFTYNNVQFVMYKADSIIDYLKYGTGFTDSLTIDLICEVGETSWGKKMPQLSIQDIAISLDQPDKYVF